MKKQVILLTLCLFFTLVTNALSAEEISINYPFAYMNRFQTGSQQLGFPEGDVLQVGCHITPAESPIKEVTIKNLDSGLVLVATLVEVGRIGSDIYMVEPMPTFDPSKHMGTWEIKVKDEKENEATAKTHKLDIKGKMPYLEGLKASGNPSAPMITWSAPSEKDIPQGIKIRYQVRLLMDSENQIHKSFVITDTKYQILEGFIKPEDILKIYVRVECQGWDKDISDTPLPIELSSQTVMLLKEALGK